MLLELENISKTYTGPQFEQAVLDGVNLQIAPGDFVGVTGASGSGKTTLLNIVSFLDEPSGGSLKLEGEAVAWDNREVLRRHRRDYIGMVFQHFNLLTRRTVLENVLFRYRYIRRVPDDLRERAEALLERLDLADLADKPCRLLSGGEMQRVAVARALIHQPKLLVADEPTGNLDRESAENLLQLFRALNEEGLTILLVTHNTDLLRFCTRHIDYVKGRFVEKPVSCA